MKQGLRDVAKLMTATAVGQGVGLLAAPVLSRVYSPEVFGVVGVFLSIASTLGVVAALRLELAVVVPRSDEEAKDVMGSAVLVIGVVTLLTAVAAFLFASPVAGLLGVPDVAPLLGWLPLYVSSLGTFQVFNYWSTRIGRFGRLASAQLTRAFATAGTQIGLGFIGLGAPGMLGGQVGGQVLANLTLLGRSAMGDTSVLRTTVSFAKTRTVLKSYFEFAVYGAPQALVNALSQGIPALVIAAAFGAGTAGQYLLAGRVIAAPGNLIGQSLRQVLYPQLSRRIDDPGVLRFSVRATVLLGLLAAVPVAFLAAFGPGVFVWLFGESWLLGGVFARYLGLLLAVGMMNIPAVSLVPLLRMQRWHAVYEVVYLAFRVAALLLGGYLGGATGAVVGIVAVGIGFNTLLILAVFKRLRDHLKAAAA